MTTPEEFIVNFTPTGMLPTREQSPYVPLSTSEIVDDVLAAAEIGITAVHLHVRDPHTGAPDFRRERYAAVIDGIRRYAPELVIGVSLSGRCFGAGLPVADLKEAGVARGQWTRPGPQRCTAPALSGPSVSGSEPRHSTMRPTKETSGCDLMLPS